MLYTHYNTMDERIITFETSNPQRKYDILVVLISSKVWCLCDQYDYMRIKLFNIDPTDLVIYVIGNVIKYRFQTDENG